MSIFKRDKNRDKNKVKVDIEKTKKIVREDIYDILKEAKDDGKTKEEAMSDLETFIRGLKDSAMKKYTDTHKDIDHVVARVLSDVNSYGLEWDE